MGTLFRILVFILALGTLGTGTAWLLARERQREATRERLLLAIAGPEANAAVISDKLRQQQASAERDLLIFGVLSFGCVLAVALVPTRSIAVQLPVSRTRAEDPVVREMIGLEQLARTTVAQRAELDQERESRHRSEQDLYLQQVLANQALQDKIRLGRDLHDGLVQSLYASGLMLESATRLISTDPAEAQRLLATTRSNLQTAIRDTRSVIDGLTPDELENRSLADSIHALLDHLDGGRLDHRQVTLAPDLPTLPEAAAAELLQIIRESVSNALRHGRATRLDLNLIASTTTLELAIRDNGCGFDPAAIRRGHGLENLTARARRLGGQLTIQSQPGNGACVNLSLPLPSHA
jgi:signal transduction histidine kinase